MKKTAALLTIFMVCLTLCLPFTALAEASDYILDPGGMLSASETKILDINCEWLADDDIPLVICLDNAGGDAAAQIEAAAQEKLTSGEGIVFYASETAAEMKAFGSLSGIFDESVCAQILSVVRERKDNVGLFDCCQCLFCNIRSWDHSGTLYTDTFYMPAFYDEAEYLTESEAAEIRQRLDTIRRKYNVDVAVIIEETMSGYDAQNAADDIYDYNFYGAGENDDGIMLYICKDPRKYAYTTHAYGQKAINQRGIAYIEAEVLPYLKNNDYYQALTVYAEKTDELLGMAQNGKIYNKRKRGTKEWAVVYAVVILVPLLIAFTKTKSKESKMKTAVENNAAADYVKNGSMQLARSNDFFLYSNVVRTERPKDSGSGGSHTSSSGRSHGGSSGSY